MIALSSTEILEVQVKDLIKKLSETKVELETMRMERDLWKGKYEELSQSRSQETLSKPDVIPRTKRTGTAPTPMSEEIDVDPGQAAIFIAKHGELPWKKGKEKARATVG